MVRVDFECRVHAANFLVLKRMLIGNGKITQVYKIFNDKEPGTTTPKKCRK
jgi:hypothetical protein